MLKFLRVHRTKLLVFFGAILMVLFLLPQAWHSLGPNPANQVAFRIDGRNFTGGDLQRAQPRLMIIMDLERTAGITMFPVPIEGIEHWMLLVHEAKQKGLVGGGQRADELLAALADVGSRRFAQFGTDPTQQAQYVAQMRDMILQALDQQIEKDRANYGPEVVESAIAEAFGVQRLFELTNAFAAFSAPELDSVAIQFLDTAIADLALIGYTEVIGEVQEPSAEQLQEHFEKYKTTRPTPDGATIGYMQDPMVQLEAVEVDLASIRAAIPIDEIEVNKRWRQNKAAYGEEFANARAAVEGELRDMRLDVIVRALEETARRELFREARDLAALQPGQKLPDTWAENRVSFDTLAAAFNTEIAKSVTLERPAAVVTVIDQWTTEEGLNLRPMGRAFATVRGQPTALPTLAMQAIELVPDSNAGIRVGIAFGPLVTPKEKLVYARLMAVRPAGPPASVDDVRPQAISDWRKLHAFERLQERVEEIRQTVTAAERIDGLRGAFKGPAMQVGVEVTRAGATMAGGGPATVANTQAMRDAIMDVVAKWDPTVETGKLPIADRVVVVPLADRYGVGAAVITGRYPVSQEVVRSFLPQLQREYSFQLSSAGKIESPYTFLQIKDRLGYTTPERKREAEDEGSEERAPQAPAPTPAS